ncbi:hypothetical protein Tco_1328385 [Tanacetum coccineum]
MNIQPPSEPSTPSNVHAEENNDHQAEFTNPFCILAKYTLEILKKHGMENGQRIGTPMATKPKLDADLSGEHVDQADDRSKIGSLMYLTSSGPDIVQALDVKEERLYCNVIRKGWRRRPLSEVVLMYCGWRTPVPSTSILGDLSSKNRSYALSWKPCQGDSLNLPDHRIHKDGDGDASFQLKLDSLPRAYAQTTKTCYKHQDSRIHEKLKDLKTKLTNNLDIQDSSFKDISSIKGD